MLPRVYCMKKRLDVTSVMDMENIQQKIPVAYFRSWLHFAVNSNTTNCLVPLSVRGKCVSQQSLPSREVNSRHNCSRTLPSQRQKWSPQTKITLLVSFICTFLHGGRKTFIPFYMTKLPVSHEDFGNMVVKAHKKTNWHTAGFKNCELNKWKT